MMVTECFIFGIQSSKYCIYLTILNFYSIKRIPVDYFIIQYFHPNRVETFLITNDSQFYFRYSIYWIPEISIVHWVFNEKFGDWWMNTIFVFIGSMRNEMKFNIDVEDLSHFTRCFIRKSNHIINCYMMTIWPNCSLRKMASAIEIERCIHSEQQHLLWSNISVNIRYIEKETRLNWKWYGKMTIDHWQHYCFDTVTELCICRILKENCECMNTNSKADILVWNMLGYSIIAKRERWKIIAEIKQIFLRENLILHQYSVFIYFHYLEIRDEKTFSFHFILGMISTGLDESPCFMGSY